MLNNNVEHSEWNCMRILFSSGCFILMQITLAYTINMYYFQLNARYYMRIVHTKMIASLWYHIAPFWWSIRFAWRSPWEAPHIFFCSFFWEWKRSCSINREQKPYFSHYFDQKAYFSHYFISNIRNSYYYGHFLCMFSISKISSNFDLKIIFCVFFVYKKKLRSWLALFHNLDLSRKNWKDPSEKCRKNNFKRIKN